MEDSQSYCSLFWNHVSIRPLNKLQPCCRFDNGRYEDEAAFFDEDIEKTLNNSFFTQLRKNALEGKKNKGCHICYDMEKRGVRSPRQKNNSRDKSQNYKTLTTKLDHIKVLDLFVGDTCNLKCIMCHPSLSSLWRTDYQKLGWPLPPRSQPIIGNLRQSLESFKYLTDVRFIGGEPLLTAQHNEALNSLKPLSEKIHLTYSTNGTVLPSPQVLETWSGFKQVSLYLSIDGVGKTNDYVRYPSVWAEVDKNMDEYLKISQTHQNIKISVLCTASIFNVWGVGELETWFDQKKKKFPQSQLIQFTVNPLSYPSYLSINNMSQEQRQKAIDCLSKETATQKKLIQWIKGVKEVDKKRELQDYVNKVDKVRKIKVQDYISEITLILK